MESHRWKVEGADGKIAEGEDNFPSPDSLDNASVLTLSVSVPVGKKIRFVRRTRISANSEGIEIGREFDYVIMLE